MENKNNIKLELSITDTKQFQLILNIINKMITDERIDKQIRINYLSELIENIGS